MKSIIYTGYTYSGGIIAGLICREIQDVIVPANMEFRLMKERHGICDLEDAIFKKADPEVIDLAIKDFKWLSKCYARPDSFFKKTGFGLDEKTANNFSKHTNNYIHAITDHSYKSSWHFYDFKSPYLKVIFWRIIRRLTKDFRYGRKEAYFAYPTKMKFDKETRKYLEKIIKDLIGDLNIEEHTIALPKAINPYRYDEIEKVINYFEDCKVIVVDRDPRDIYLELKRSGKERYIPISSDPQKKANAFIKLFKSMRNEQEKLKSNKNVLLLRFEDLCIDYDETLRKIYDFLQINEKKHISKRKYFNPDESIRNVSLWTNASKNEKDVITIIEKELNEFLYQGQKHK